MSDDKSNICLNCGINLPEVQLVLHARLCKNINSRCPECGQMIQNDEMQEHKNQKHEKIECEQCNKKIIREELSNHKKNKCKNRLIECKFCGLNVTHSLINEHENICGSKTDNCPFCNQFVPIREIDLHHKYICNKKNINK